MSGRSGFVRAKRKETKSKPPPTPVPQTSSSTELSTSPTSPVPRQPVFFAYPAHEHGIPQVEKSTLRAAVESKSENIRTGIGGLFSTAKKPEKAVQSSSEARISDTSFSGSESLRSDYRRHWRGPNSLSQTPCQPGDRFTIRDVWLNNADTVVFLRTGPEDKYRNPSGLPHFRCHSRELARLPGLFSLLKESRKSRPAVISMSEDVFENLESHRPISDQSLDHEKATQFEGVSHVLSLVPPAGYYLKDLSKWQDSVRNVLALLHNLDIVGTNLYETLVNLFQRLEEWSDDVAARSLIVNYIDRKGLMDVRSDPQGAVAILAFSEFEDIRWVEAYREGFAHAVGMHHLLQEKDLKILSPYTRQRLEYNALETSNRILLCAKRFKTFTMEEMWPQKAEHSLVTREVYESVSRMLVSHYEKKSRGVWPPPSDNSQTWLTPAIVSNMSRDFGALYDMLVDRSAHLEQNQLGVWRIVNHRDPNFRADIDGLDMVKLLTGFDDRNRYPHLPYPLTIQPRSIDPVANRQSRHSADPGKSKGFKRLLGKKEKQQAVPSTETGLDPSDEVMYRFAYSEATNSGILTGNFVSNRLVEAFALLEKDEKVCEIDPRSARNARWLVIYGILQSLASISETVPGLLHEVHDLPYFVICSIGAPSWGGGTFPAPRSETSHCWSVVGDWNDAYSVYERPLLLGDASPRRPGTMTSSSFSAPSASEKSHYQQRALPIVGSRGRSESQVQTWSKGVTQAPVEEEESDDLYLAEDNDRTPRVQQRASHQVSSNGHQSQPSLEISDWDEQGIGAPSPLQYYKPTSPDRPY